MCGLLVGCAGRMIESGMKSMVGQPLSAAVAKLGVPTDEREIAGHKVYTWFYRSNDRRNHIVLPD
jgi:hypothetical protein